MYKVLIASLKPKKEFAKGRVTKATTMLLDLGTEQSNHEKACNSFLDSYEDELMKNQMAVNDYENGEELLISALEGMGLHG